MDSQSKTSGLRAVSASALSAPLPAAQMARARTIQENCLQAIASLLSEQLDSPVTANLARVDARLGTWDTADEGACRLTLEMEPVPGHASVIIGSGMVSQLLRLLLKAPNRTAVAPTEIELHVLRETFDLIVRQLAAAWASPRVRLRWTPADSVLADDGSLLVFDGRLVFGHIETSLRFAIPALVVRLLATETGIRENPAAVRSSLLAALRDARVEVEAVLAGSSLLMSDLLSLEPGQVLTLGVAAGSPLECRINGKAIFRGDWVQQAAKTALQIL